MNRQVRGMDYPISCRLYLPHISINDFTLQWFYITMIVHLHNIFYTYTTKIMCFPKWTISKNPVISDLQFFFLHVEFDGAKNAPKILTKLQDENNFTKILRSWSWCSAWLSWSVDLDLDEFLFRFDLILIWFFS